MTDNTITIDRADLTNLAHYFYLWKDAYASGNHEGTSVFGIWLRDIQDRTGAEVIDRDDLVRSIDRAHERLIR